MSGKPRKPELDPADLVPTSGRERMTISYPVAVISKPVAKES